ncbi:isoprenylcysteine carboxylmethyltransferase family protein [Chryseobacterium sp.]|uniref:isoprenylcysteine carboxylmethyltransferase family protein n=1 Tax=Chryseobacterium sp. TaxID=1871047 RepID=UPI00321AF283
MKILDVLIYMGMLIWFLLENYNLKNLRSGNEDQKIDDKIGLVRLWTVFIISLTGPVIAANFISLPISDRMELRYLGFFIFLSGIGLRLAAIRHLGRFFTINISIRKDHQLITGGVYKYIRHPSYSACIVIFIGVGLALNNWLSLFIAVVPAFLTLNKRIVSEEKALTEKFGDEYIQYRNNTKRWIPFIF